jgi:tRNA (mo5U34)-methyltransferase
MSRLARLRRRWSESAPAAALALAAGRGHRSLRGGPAANADAGAKSGSGESSASQPHVPRLEKLSSKELDALRKSVWRTVEYRKWKKTASASSDPGLLHAIPAVDALPDEELDALNEALPWGAYVLDARGRAFGRPWSSDKRNTPQVIPDPRIVALDQRTPLRDAVVLELGCFEGLHTVALADRGARVLATDARVENLAKTLVRCWAFGHAPTVFRWNLEEDPPPEVDIDCDVAHHVGVLYHLTDPVGHLRRLAPHVRRAIMLDTHVASDAHELEDLLADGETLRVRRMKERGRHDPFAGMEACATWLLEDDLVRLLRELGFATVDVVQRRDERNGPRLLIHAER